MKKKNLETLYVNDIRGNSYMMSVSCIFLKILFINQDYIHCGLPINSLIRKKLSFFLKKKYINNFKWSLFTCKGSELKF